MLLLGTTIFIGMNLLDHVLFYFTDQCDTILRIQISYREKQQHIFSPNKNHRKDTTSLST